MAQTDDPIEYWRLAKQGISLLLNNRSTEAQTLFQEYPDNVQMAAGFSYDALMSFEEEKLNLALTTLKDTEKKCTAERGWLKTMKSKMFANRSEDIVDALESQIIQADTQVCVAIITFLQQEYTGYLKGGWILRKAWKVYQQTYNQVEQLYKKNIGDLNLPEPTDFSWTEIDTTAASTSTEQDIYGSNTTICTTATYQPKNGYKPNLNIPINSNMSHSQSTNSITNNSNKNKIPRSMSTLSGNESRINYNRSSSYTLLSPFAAQWSYLSSSLSSLLMMDRIDPEITLESDTIVRLMGAICFGYGLLQLGISLLPPSLLKVTNFLGFTGNRTAGISNLMYARKGTGMRAPLATLALLWYHTIVRPYYALDGINVKAGIEAASLLIQESEEQYAESALFLFFKGRVFRLDSNIPMALKSFQMAVDNSSQREIKLLSLHEVGWCHLIQLEFEKAQKTFTQLKAGSRWSRAFYTYLLIVCLGSTNMLTDVVLINQLSEQLKNSSQKGTQLEVFMNRRIKLFPTDAEKFPEFSSSYWKLLVYELLFFWNALPSCNLQCRNKIISDCSTITHEPMPGMAMLIQGECYTIQGNYDSAVESLKNCLLYRQNSVSKDDTHISAYAEFILGILLLKRTETENEGKELINHANNSYKEYDFDNKLQVRIDMALKNMI